MDFLDELPLSFSDFLDRFRLRVFLTDKSIWALLVVIVFYLSGVRWELTACVAGLISSISSVICWMVCILLFWNFFISFFKINSICFHWSPFSVILSFESFLIKLAIYSHFLSKPFNWECINSSMIYKFGSSVYCPIDICLFAKYTW